MKSPNRRSDLAFGRPSASAGGNVASAPLPFEGHRGPEDDFFCLRHKVWYPSLDCAIRTLYHTCPSCRRCEQGRFNVRRHATNQALAVGPFNRILVDR